MPQYRVKIDWTYNTTSNANTATTNINNLLAQSWSDVTERASRSSTRVTFTAVVADETIATDLTEDLISAWNVGTRTGKASCVRVGD